MVNLGFYNTSSSRTHVRFGFPTFASAGANVAPSSAFEAADLRIYKATDGAALSATQRSSANGITMTSPFDSLTGAHTVDIDLTDNTDAGFYASGCYYEVWLCPDETVDSQTLTGVPLACFEIGVAKADATHVGGTAQTAGDLVALLNAIDDFIDTEVAAIKTKTDNLPSDPADQSAVEAAITTSQGVITAILGALNGAAADGDPTTTDTMVAYLKQIINTLEGSAGIPTWAAGAAPANAVSLAEAIRYIYEQIFTAAHAEVGQEAPAASQTMKKMLQYLYKAWRNKHTQTSSQYSLFADDTTTVDQKATVSDDGTTFTKGEVATGP